MRLGLRRLRDVPLFWKLLLPFLGLVVVIGLLGSFLTVRNLSTQAQATLDHDLLRESLDVRALVHDRELYLLESANFAANLQGVGESVRRHDRASIERLLRSVLALKSDLGLLAVIDPAGDGFSEFEGMPGTRPVLTEGGSWKGIPFVDRALRSTDGNMSPGVLQRGGEPMLVVAAPICISTTGCSPVGVALTGVRIDEILREARSRLDATNTIEFRSTGVAVYDEAGVELASAGPVVRGRAPNDVSRLTRRRAKVNGVETATLYAPYTLGGDPAGTIAVSRPTAAAFASARATGLRLALLVLLSMLGVIALGAALSRFMLAQVRPLVATNRALGRGDFRARAPVLGNDELGELAVGLNDMADQLQASHETLELRVRQRTEEVQRLLKERTQFFASVSHEFRTPLAVILGQVNMLRDAEYRKKNSPRSLETIQESSEQLLSLIDDLLAAARAEAGQLEVSMESVRLNDVVVGVQRTLEGLAHSGEHDLTIDVPEQLPAMHADPARLREILLNLVDNSVKYTPAGGLIELSARNGNGVISVSVSDNGPGIPKRLSKKIFQPFAQVPGTSTQRGQSSSGLGLALTKRLVEAQGGTISFESTKGAGTTFVFTLPLADEQPTRRGKGTA
jgi:signal transduction histidine kinase